MSRNRLGVNTELAGFILKVRSLGSRSPGSISKKLVLAKTRFLDCDIVKTGEGLAAIAAHTCFVFSIALCTSESLSCRA
jgi:hypothetical protein